MVVKRAETIDAFNALLVWAHSHEGEYDERFVAISKLSSLGLSDDVFTPHLFKSWIGCKQFVDGFPCIRLALLFMGIWQADFLGHNTKHRADVTNSCSRKEWHLERNIQCKLLSWSNAGRDTSWHEWHRWFVCSSGTVLKMVIKTTSEIERVSTSSTTWTASSTCSHSCVCCKLAWKNSWNANHFKLSLQHGSNSTRLDAKKTISSIVTSTSQSDEKQQDYS